MRYRRLKVEGGTYFFTVVTAGRRPIFADSAAVALFETATVRVQSRHPFEIEAQVILPDHLHAIWQLPPGDAEFSTRWRLIKEAFTKAFIRTHEVPLAGRSRQSKREQAIWQRRFWEHLISDEEDLAAHLDYLHLNPVRHGLVTTPRDWPHSTFAKWVERGVYDPHWGSDAMPSLPDWAKECE